MSQNPHFDRLLKETIEKVRIQHKSSVTSWLAAKWKSKTTGGKATEVLSQMDQPMAGLAVGIAGVAGVSGAAIGWTGVGLAVPAAILFVTALISFGRKTKGVHREKNKIRNLLAQNATVNGMYVGKESARRVRASIRHLIKGQLKDEASVIKWMSYLQDSGFQDFQNARRKYSDAASHFEEARKKFDATEKVQETRLIGFEVYNKYCVLVYAYTYLVYRWERFVAYQYLIRLTTERYNDIIRKAVHRLDREMEAHVTDNRQTLSKYW